jgi:hypothetical protein
VLSSLCVKTLIIPQIRGNWQKQLLNTPWILSECSLNAFWILPEYSLNALWMLSECSLNALWMLSECSLNALWMLSECSLNTLWLLLEYSLNTLWILSEYSLITPWILYIYIVIQTQHMLRLTLWAIKLLFPLNLYTHTDTHTKKLFRLSYDIIVWAIV